MLFPEFSDRDDIPKIPTGVTHDVMSSARKDGAIDRQYTHRRLEFLCQALDLFENPKLFTVYDGDSFTRSTVLTVPTGSLQSASKQLFVAVNSETSTQGEDGFELRQIAQFGYRWLVNEKRIARSDATTGKRAAWDNTWHYKDEFGPHIVREGEFVYVTHWDTDRLRIPNNTLGRLSIAGLAELKIAEELIQRVQWLTPANENDHIQLISEEL